MNHSFLICILLLSVPSRLVASKDITVDADLTEKIGNSYPSLDQAISAILSGSTLIDDENIITLKANCIGKHQYFPILSQNINGKNSGSCRLIIKFENTPSSINNADQCRLLPILELGNGACMAIDNLSSLTISGLNIKYSGDKCKNTVTNIETVTFTNFCLNNSEPSRLMANGELSSFELNSIASLSMKSGIYFSDSIKQIMITQTREAALENITLVAMEKAIDSDKSAFAFSTDESIHANLSVNNFRVICEPATLVMPNVVSTSNVDLISISNLNISNCDFNSVATKNPAIISVGRASTLTIQKVIIDNLTFGAYQQSIFVVSSVINATLRDFQISNLHTDFGGQSYSQIVDLNDKTSTNDSLHKNSIIFSQ